MSTKKLIKVCPHCESHNWRNRKPGKFTKATHGPEKRYYCKDCQTAFEETTTREAVDDGGSKNRNVSASDLQAAREAMGIEVD